jgi:metal-dependent amidase/aminoacylase/carboxypeptidase family protein
VGHLDSTAFAQHDMPGPSGPVSRRAGATTASGDDLRVAVVGRQGHGGMTWNTIDPITISAQVVVGVQAVVGRRTDLTASPAWHWVRI